MIKEAAYTSKLTDVKTKGTKFKIIPSSYLLNAPEENEEDTIKQIDTRGKCCVSCATF
jgi:hypothetical protein